MVLHVQIYPTSAVLTNYFSSVKYRWAFLVSIFIQLGLLICFSSEYSLDLFYPFVSTFLDISYNPWQYYYEQGLNADAFPYHALMLILLYPFAVLAKITSLHFLFKIPLLICGVWIFFILLKLFPSKEKEIHIYYSFNPIVWYAIYIHSQLDIIPTALLLCGIYLLTIKKIRMSALLFGLSLATKLHVIIALPLLLFYLYKTASIKKAIQYGVFAVSIFVLLDSPFLHSQGFWNMVFLNSKQSLLFDSYYEIGTLKLFLPIMGIVLVYLHLFSQYKINDDLLYFYFGILFTVTIMFIYPAPAWYIWAIPFIAIYFINDHGRRSKIILYIVLSLVYLIFFIFFYRGDYWDIIFRGENVDYKINNEKLANISFTLLEILLAATLYMFYKYGIKSNTIYNKKNNLVIGIGGDSGAGKTTLIKSLHNIIGSQLLYIEGDGEHKWERGHQNWNTFTHLDPKANHIHKQADIIYGLKNNETVFRRDYDHHTGKFTEPLKVVPKKIIVIAGLHPFYLPKMRKQVDVKIYIDTNEALRQHWKVIRDTLDRGHEKNKILQQIHLRKQDANKYIHPQKDFADLVIHYFCLKDFNIGDINAKLDLGLRLTLDANVHVEDIADMLDCTWNYNDDLKSQYIEIVRVPNINFQDIAEKTIKNLKEIITHEATWEEGYKGFIQLIMLKMISEKFKENNL